MLGINLHHVCTIQFIKDTHKFDSKFKMWAKLFVKLLTSSGSSIQINLQLKLHFIL